MCLYPKLIKNRKYVANKKNGGKIPAVTDNRTLYVPVKCGKCMECRKQKSRNWNVRLLEDFKTDTYEVTNNKGEKTTLKKGAWNMVTLTFSDESLYELEQLALKKSLGTATGYDLDNLACTIGVRRFLERWRKKHKRSLRHWLVTELGGNFTERIHIHGIVWTDHKEDIEKIWKYGNVHIGNYKSEKGVNYTVKYLSKSDPKHPNYNPKTFTSSGIGKNYLTSQQAKYNTFNGKDTNETYRNKQGYKMNLPIYYRNHIYNEEEREKLWIQLLDKNVRYVDGIKVDVSTNEDEYFKLLKLARKKNKILGFGNNEINWNKKRYENTLRNMKRRERERKVKRNKKR